jgi:hypothetical protein
MTGINEGHSTVENYSSGNHALLEIKLLQIYGPKGHRF